MDHRTPRGIEARLEDLSSRAPVPGEVVIEASYSSINYKDASWPGTWTERLSVGRLWLYADLHPSLPGRAMRARHE